MRETCAVGLAEDRVGRGDGGVVGGAGEEGLGVGEGRRIAGSWPPFWYTVPCKIDGK